MKKETNSHTVFKSTVVLCCMIALICLGIGSLGTYLFFYAHPSTDTSPQASQAPVFTPVPEDNYEETKKCSQTVTFDILAKIDQEEQAGAYQFVVAKQFQSDPMLLRISKDIYESLEVGRSYELEVSYVAKSENIKFFDTDYMFTKATLTNRVGAEQFDTTPICE